MDAALKGTQVSLETTNVNQSPAYQTAEEDAEKRAELQRRVSQLNEQIVKKNLEMEKEKIRHEKMQLKLMNIAGYQLKQRDKEKRRTQELTVTEDEIKKLREMNKALQSQVNKQANQFVRLQKKDREQAGAGITPATTVSTRPRLSLTMKQESAARPGQDADPFTSLKLDDYSIMQNSRIEGGTTVDVQNTQRAQLKKINELNEQIM